MAMLNIESTFEPKIARRRYRCIKKQLHCVFTKNRKPQVAQWELAIVFASSSSKYQHMEQIPAPM